MSEQQEEPKPKMTKDEEQTKTNEHQEPKPSDTKNHEFETIITTEPKKPTSNEPQITSESPPKTNQNDDETQTEQNTKEETTTLWEQLIKLNEDIKETSHRITNEITDNEDFELEEIRTLELILQITIDGIETLEEKAKKGHKWTREQISYKSKKPVKLFNLNEEYQQKLRRQIEDFEHKPMRTPNSTPQQSPKRQSPQHLPHQQVTPNYSNYPNYSQYAYEPRTYNCSFCDENHPSAKCQKYPNKQSRERLLREQNLCLNCTKRHKGECWKTYDICNACNRPHHPGLCSVKDR